MPLTLAGSTYVAEEIDCVYRGENTAILQFIQLVKV